jgi:hypothetical protein
MPIRSSFDDGELNKRIVDPSYEEEDGLGASDGEISLRPHSLDEFIGQEKVKEKMHDYIFFEPLPQVGRAVFIAAPHRGTPFADMSIARFIAGLVTLPVKVVNGIIEPAVTLIAPELKGKKQPINGIANLSAKDDFIVRSASLPISPSVPFHSIIGNDTPDVPLAESSDGIVPYSSSHLEGAASEKVIPSGHSVQETPEAILEIRRIMHEHLAGK